MVEGQFAGSDLFAAIVAHALCQLRTPPVCFPELPGFFALPADMDGVGVQV